MKAKSKQQKYCIYTNAYKIGKKAEKKNATLSANAWIHFDRYVDDCSSYVGESANDVAARYASRYSEAL